MTSERVTLPSCDHTKLVCPAITWAEREIERLNAYQDKTAMAWTKLTESQEREIERLNEALHEDRPELFSFDTIMLLGRRILAEYYPEDIFNGSSGDSGPEFVVALRAAIKRIDEQRAHA